ncbi:aluminum activated malate transporter-domain-containing protein [Sporodiniella umbellata]|nr:aluminum activated malate transporter-domain-containing protein [Sporodiniella umbellata]
MVRFDENEKPSDYRRASNLPEFDISDLSEHGKQNETCVRMEDHPKERITIIENLPTRDDTTLCSQSTQYKHSPFQKVKRSVVIRWLILQYRHDDNRYAFQVAVAFTLAAIFVVIDPIAKAFHNPFWMGVAVVAVLDNTIGGFLTLGIQRIIGTIIGGVASIVVMTVVRAIYSTDWSWRPALLLCILMFIQIFFIAKIKLIPNYSYAGSIGLLTTVIILLAGYQDIIQDGLSYSAVLGAWRILNMIIGVLVAMLASFCIFPLKASSVMRTNLGQSMEQAAELYQKSAEYYLDLTQGGSQQSLTSILERRLSKLPTDDTIKATFQRLFSNESPTAFNDPFNSSDEMSQISNEAIKVLSKLQSESTRLRNVSHEYKVQTCFHLLGGKERSKRYMRRAKRYNEAIEAMKRVVWPLASFRLLFPLVQHSQISDTQPAHLLRSRMTPTRETIECFADGLSVMRKLGSILKNHQRPLSDFSDEWSDIHRLLASGNLHAQRELKEMMCIGLNHPNMDGHKLISYYGFLVRSSMIWEGLKTIVDQLSPLNGTLSRASSCRSGLTGSSLPTREAIPAAE